MKLNLFPALNGDCILVEYVEYRYILIDGGYVDTCKVTVEALSKKVTDVSLDKKELNIVVGEKTTINATINPDYAENKNISWTSSDKNIATVETQLSGNISSIESQLAEKINAVENELSNKIIDTQQSLANSLSLAETAVSQLSSITDSNNLAITSMQSETQRRNDGPEVK